MDDSIFESDSDFNCYDAYMSDNGFDYMVTVDQDDCDLISLECNQSADAFRLVSDELLYRIKELSIRGAFFMPAWICLATFSCELYLKSLLLSDRYPNYNLSRVKGLSHRLETLYSKLEGEDQKAIWIATNENEKQIFTEEEFNTHLKTIDNAFVNWRYSFEPEKSNGVVVEKKLAINTIFLQAFQSAVFKVVEPFILTIGQTLAQYLEQCRVTDPDEIKRLDEMWKE